MPIPGSDDVRPRGAAMTDLLEKAFAEAARLPGREQDALVAWILHELTSEQRWERAFADSADVLAQLANEALLEHRDARTKALDPKRLRMRISSG